MLCMDIKFLGLLLFSFFLLSCDGGSGELPEITKQDVEKASELETLLQSEIHKGDIVEALEFDGDVQQKGFVTHRLIKELIGYILPDHIQFFDKHHKGLNEELDTFAEYGGVYGRCYQFRVFYKYKDSRIGGVKWASSILSIPAKNSNSVMGGVVLAPSLDGFTPFVESGLWLKACRKGLATLMPESLFRKNGGEWQKLHFDPTPPYKTVDEYSLYEESIRRYENLLKINVDLLKNIGSIKTDRGSELQSLNVMEVNPKRVGFWGSSFGAIVGSLVVAKDPSIRAAVLAVGGGDLPYVVSRSQVGLFRKTRREQMKLLGIDSIDGYEDFISNYIESDPINYAKASDAPRLHMIIAKNDRSVPTQSQYQLWRKFGSPSNTRIQSGHVLTLLLTAWFRRGPSRRALDSLVEKLSQEPAE